MPGPAKTKYSGNGSWDQNWTSAMESMVRRGHDEGKDIHEITDDLHGAYGLARWESVRDKMKELWPGEAVKGA
ncbi:hypothetical protein W97_06853 [Coniosporium apollinis CBS 100218]|uniref:Myb-like domain-containing protein n=1 Tax=Coniosporium apollinis (strain CBS 100218) TaxID=1168221 RepID=R7Z0I4_CONA1|nr:uncharacterized protein W97_06853 [Coniosporium apollinis CBS 100218]EON67710.1 hypothetical protein W97_06853 [Coniosporium apollinis CBS 100218]